MRPEGVEGSFVVYSAGEGQSAMDRLSDADADPNSVFTRAFLPLLRADLPLLDAIKSSQERVYALAGAADHEQTPAYYDEVRRTRLPLARVQGAERGARFVGVRRRLRGDDRRADKSRHSRGADRQASRGAVEGAREEEIGGASRVAGRERTPGGFSPAPTTSDGALRRSSAQTSPDRAHRLIAIPDGS